MPTNPPKHNFKGETKKKDDYDADWVLHDNAWVTKRQRKKAIQDRKEARADRQARNAASTLPPAPPAATPPTTTPILGGPAPTPTPPPATGGIGRNPPPGGMPLPPGSIGRQPPINVPSWWINQAITNPTDPNQQFANVANALLPTLAPEDQRTLATYLATNFKDVYGGYANTNFGPAPTEMTADLRNQYLSPQRAQTALALMDKMKTASGATDMGAGYDFLKNAVGLINQFLEPTGVLPRERYNQFSEAVSSMVGQAGKDISAYANLAQLFNMPKFTAGPLINNAPNAKLFG